MAQVLECFLNVGVTNFGSALLIKFSFFFFFFPPNFKCQLIVCQMSSTRCPTLNWFLVPLFLIVLVVNLGIASYVESILLYTLTAVFTLAHIHYGVRVVSNLGQKGFHLVLISIRKGGEGKISKESCLLK